MSDLAVEIAGCVDALRTTRTLAAQHATGDTGSDLLSHLASASRELRPAGRACTELDSEQFDD